MSFGSKRSSAPPPKAIASTPQLHPDLVRDKSLKQVSAASVLLSDVNNQSTIDETRRKARVLGPAASILG